MSLEAYPAASGPAVPLDASDSCRATATAWPLRLLPTASKLDIFHTAYLSSSAALCPSGLPEAAQSQQRRSAALAVTSLDRQADRRL